MQKNKKKSVKKEENRHVNIRDPKVRKEIGLIWEEPRFVMPIRTKTKHEREVLRNAKNSIRKEDMHFHTAPYKYSTVKAKLIIYLKPNKDFEKTTYSKECSLSQIAEILSNYRRKKNNESLIAKYSYDGKTYQPNTYPYWIR